MLSICGGWDKIFICSTFAGLRNRDEICFGSIEAEGWAGLAGRWAASNKPELSNISIIYRYMFYNDIQKIYCKVMYDMYIRRKCIRKLLHRYKARSWGNNCPFDLNLLINIMSEKRIFLANILWPGGHAPLSSICKINNIFQIPIFANIWPYFISLRYTLCLWYLPCKKRSRSSAGPIFIITTSQCTVGEKIKVYPARSSTIFNFLT